MKTFVIAQRELKVMFLSPLAWVIFFVMQLISSLIFLFLLDGYSKVQQYIISMPDSPYGVTELVITSFYEVFSIILMLIIPILTMRLIADERKNKTISLLFSAPLSMTEIIVGKFIGLYTFLLLIILTITLMPLSLIFSGPIDYGWFASTVIGACLLIASVTAIGLYMSSLTKQPIVAAISTYGILLLFWLFGIIGNPGGTQTENSLAILSLLQHFESFRKGLFSSADFFYFVIIIVTFIILSIKRLDADRLQH